MHTKATKLNFFKKTIMTSCTKKKILANIIKRML